MTNGKTTLKFSHNPHDAVQAARDAISLAAAWLPQDSESRAKLEVISSDLRAVQAHIQQPSKIPY